MRVAVDDQVRVVTREEARGSGAAELVTVADVDADSPHFEIQYLRQLRIGRIVDVAVHGLNRREFAQLVENARGADVSGVNDQFGAAKCRNGFRPKQAVRVGDEAYDHGRGVG